MINKMGKKGISDKALVTLVIVAVVVSIACTWVSLSKLRTIEITGLATEVTGTVNVSAGIAADISLPVSTVNFGTMQMDQTNDTTDDNPAPFNVSNDGNVCVNITIYRDTTNWFTGTVHGGNASNTNDTMYQVECPGSNCQSGTVTSWTNITTSAVKAIAGLNWTSGNDTTQVEVKIHVPSDETPGAKGTVVTFSASDSGLC